MSGTLMFIIFIAVLVVVLAIGAAQKGKKARAGERNAEAQATTDDIHVDTGFKDANDFFIAGMSHHCTRRDVGLFTGMVYNDSGNTYDRRAMAVWSHQANRSFGFVPAAILDEYRAWCKGAKCTCVGYVFFDGEMLRGRVRAYLPSCDKDAVMEDISEYARQVCEHFGWTVPNFTA